jgi:hypothetical protein
VPREKLTAQLISSMRETLALFDQAEAVMNRSYAPGKWTLREILVHLSDTETVLLDRLRRLAAEEEPTLMAFDENRWAAGLFYKTRDLAIARIQFEAARRSVIELLSTLNEKVDENVGTHSEAGTRTFEQISNHVYDHCAHHLEQARAIVEGRTWSPKK